MNKLNEVKRTEINLIELLCRVVSYSKIFPLYCSCLLVWLCTTSQTGAFVTASALCRYDYLHTKNFLTKYFYSSLHIKIVYATIHCFKRIIE
jgi:hypothetical protein